MISYPRGRIRDRGPIPDAVRNAFLDKMTLPTSTDCCRWSGNVDSHGYGYICTCVDGHRMVWLAHHVAWVLWMKEPLPTDGKTIVAHTENCRYRDCVNPAHLVVMTYQQHRDMMHRIGKTGSIGNPKITADVANQIREARLMNKLTYQEIAKKYPATVVLADGSITQCPLSRSQIIKICRGESWA